MNPNTNDLKWSHSDLEGTAFLKQGYKQVPEELQKEASGLLGDKPNVKVPKGHKLDKWAEQFRKKKKKKKRSIAKASKRRNR